MSREINNSEDVIDSRDIIKRIEDLQSCDDLDSGESEELKVLLVLQSDCEGYAADWQYGEALIRDSYFEEYAEELARDCGMVQDGNEWPNYCIDWERAADDLKLDYTCVDFDGVNYWIR